MFARIYSRARSLLSSTPSEQGISILQAPRSSPPPGPDETMVTTRRSGGDPDTGTPRRSKRTLEGSAMPVPEFKRRRHSVDNTNGDAKDRGGNDPDDIKDTIRVAIPDEDANKNDTTTIEEPLQQQVAQEDEATPEELVLRSHRELSEEKFEGIENAERNPHGGNKSPANIHQQRLGKVNLPTKDESISTTPTANSKTSFNGTSHQNALEQGIQTSPAYSKLARDFSISQRRTKEQRSPISPTYSDLARSLPTRKGKNSGDSITDKAVDKAIAPPEIKPATSATRSHIHFGSEEPEIPPAQSPESTPVESHAAPADQDVSSDDEGPETITQASAVQQTKAAAAEASKAIDEAVAASERKRQDRAARRAEEQKQKQHRREKIEKKAQQKVSMTPQIDTELPDMLPEAILAAAPEKRPATPPPDFTDTNVKNRKLEQQNRHTKFLEKGEKRIKDIKRGPVHMRVLAKPNELLAPKVDPATRNIREHWLRGRSMMGKAGGKQKGKAKGRWDNAKMERKSFSGSFLRKDIER